MRPYIYNNKYNIYNYKYKEWKIKIHTTICIEILNGFLSLSFEASKYDSASWL